MITARALRTHYSPLMRTTRTGRQQETMATKTGQYITDDQLRHVECGANHSGSHRLSAATNRQAAECDGCGTFYTAGELATPTAGLPRGIGVRRIGK